jgi:hypothetical protein
MASRAAPPCSHDLRPGTAVCLRCQHAERGAKRAKQHQLLARGAAAVLSLAAIAATGVAAATAIRARGGTPRLTPRTVESSALAATDTSEATDATEPDTTVASAASVSGPPTSVVVATGTVVPIVPPGRTFLRDTMVADRVGDTVRVSFDLELSRTRRPDKFEGIVRSTLPQVFGPSADSALRALPWGAVARAGDLVTTLPERGFRIPVAGGRTIAVWPETREGRDGPLVVAYRAVASR